jgi:hypothetical protein
MRESMAKNKPPDYRKAFKEASAALTAMKIREGALHGWFLGSGDRAEAIARFRRWVEVAAEHLSTEQIDQIAWRIEICLQAEALHKGDEKGALKWHRQWQSELMEDKRSHRQVQR